MRLKKNIYRLLIPLGIAISLAPRALPQANQESCGPDCLPIFRAAMDWFLQLENFPPGEIILDMTLSGVEFSTERVRRVDTSVLDSLAVTVGSQQGTTEAVLDCDDARRLMGRPRCRLRMGRALVALWAPVVREDEASMVFRWMGQKPGSDEFEVAILVLTIGRLEGEWRVVAFRRLNSG